MDIEKRDYIGVDAMGGDYGVDKTIPGVLEALEEEKDLYIAVYWNKDQIDRILMESEVSPGVISRLKIVGTPDDGNIPQNLKITKRDEIRWDWTYAWWSMMKPIYDMINNKSDIWAVLSAWNTASFWFWITALCRKIIRWGPISLMITAPNHGNSKWSSVILDVWADMWTNKDAQKIAEKIVEDAVMAYSYCKNTLKIETPKVWLINVWIEEDKWNDSSKKAHQLLKAKFWEAFVWNIEPDKVCDNQCDIIVTDGFTGNVTLKTVEWIVKLFEKILRKSVDQAGLIPRLWAKLASDTIIKPTFNFFDPEKNPAGIFLWFEQPVVKVHGNADYIWFKNGILQLFRYRNEIRKASVIEWIRQEIEDLREKKEAA